MFESPVTLIKFTSWRNGYTDEMMRATIFLDFILFYLNNVPQNHSNFNCNLNSDELGFEKRKEIDNIIKSVC